MLSQSEARRLLAVTTFEAENWGMNLSLSRLQNGREQPSAETLRFYALRARQLATCLDYIADHLPMSTVEKPTPVVQPQRRRRSNSRPPNVSQFTPRKRVG